MNKFENVRIKILKYLWDVEIGAEHLEKDTGFGAPGTKLFEKLGDPLTSVEFIAQLSYLENKGMIERRPATMPRTKSKEQELQLAWYKITSFGTDVVEGNSEDSGLPNIQQVISIGKISSNQSQLSIGAIGSKIDFKIEHSKSNDIKNLLNELIESLKEIHSAEIVEGAGRLVDTMKLELSNPEPEQDIRVIESTLKRLKKKLEPFQKPLAIIGSLASILGLVL